MCLKIISDLQKIYIVVLKEVRDLHNNKGPDREKNTKDLVYKYEQESQILDQLDSKLPYG